jgi:hypothetical protein
VCVLFVLLLILKIRQDKAGHGHEERKSKKTMNKKIDMTIHENLGEEEQKSSTYV